MTPAQIAAKLTPGRALCLSTARTYPITTWDACRAARKKGLLKRSTWEWADKYFLWLRQNGLIKADGYKAKDRMVHSITDLGLAVLAELDKLNKGAN